jgi:hypothetical protein
MIDSVALMEQIGRDGCTVSICCGPCGSRPFAWSVHVLNPNGEKFDRPYLAESFAHAVAIAAFEINRRRWGLDIIYGLPHGRGDA